MPLTAVESAYFDHAKGALPRFLFQSSDAPQDILGGFAKLFGKAHTQIEDWIEQAYIGSATDIYLDQHARDYGTSRRANENDATLRERLQKPQAVVTRPLLLNQIDRILVAAGGSAGAVMIEMRYDRLAYSDATPGGTRSFWSRGYRLGARGLNGFVVILPGGTSDIVAAAVDEYLRIAKAGGFRHSVERAALKILSALGLPFAGPLGEVRLHKYAHALGHDLRDLLSRLGVYLLS